MAGQITRKDIIKLLKQEERDKRIRNNGIFQKDDGNFYRKVDETSEYTGQIPNSEKFVNFWTSIWEDERTIPHRKWMEKIKRKVKERIRRVEDLRISEKELGKMIKKRKKLVGTWYRWNTKLLVESIANNMEKANYDNGGMDRRSR